MLAAALFASAIGFGEVKVLTQPGDPHVAMLVQAEDQGQKVLVQMSGSLSVSNGPGSRSVIEVKEDSIPVIAPEAARSPALRLEGQAQRLNRSSALALHAMIEALSFRSNDRDGSWISPEELLCLVVKEEALEEPISEEVATRRLVDQSLRSAAIGV